MTSSSAVSWNEDDADNFENGEFIEMLEKLRKRRVCRNAGKIEKMASL